MRITTVVVTHNRPRLLAQVIDALHRQTRQCDEIIVVDNASDVETQKLLASLSGITVLRSERNLGGTGGFSWGMAQAHARGCDWIWLLDDDAVPRIDALAELLRAADQLPASRGAICGTVREFGSVATAHRRTFGQLVGRERHIPRAAYHGPPVAIDTGSFVGFLVASHVVDRIGLPDTALFLAYDDTEYSLRMKRAGFSLWLAPSSIVDHLRSESTRLRTTEFGRRHYFNVRNRIVVKRIYATLPVIAGLSASLLGLALWLRCKNRFRYKSARILMQAIADGYRVRLGAYPPELERLDQASLSIGSYGTGSSDRRARTEAIDGIDRRRA